MSPLEAGRQKEIDYSLGLSKVTSVQIIDLCPLTWFSIQFWKNTFFYKIEFVVIGIAAIKNKCMNPYQGQVKNQEMDIENSKVKMLM